MKVLSGAIQPDAGDMSLDGARYAPADPLDARRAGRRDDLPGAVAGAAPDGGREHPARHGAGAAGRGRSARDAASGRRARWTSCTTRASAPTPWWARCPSPRSRSSRSRARWRWAAACWCWTSRPAAWPRPTPRRCSSWWRGCGEQGHAIVYISHFLEEAKRVADRFTVLRDGATVGGGAMAATTVPEIVDLMVGRRVEQLYPRSARAPRRAAAGGDGPGRRRQARARQLHASPRRGAGHRRPGRRGPHRAAARARRPGPGRVRPGEAGRPRRAPATPGAALGAGHGAGQRGPQGRGARARRSASPTT